MLDNPIWHALTGPQSTLGDPNNGPLACRYDTDVAPFSALPDTPTPDAWDALRTLVGPGGIAVLFPSSVPEEAVPERWTTHARFPGLQMLPTRVFTAPDVDLVTLGADDVPDMLHLVGRTEPGPFARRTIEMGTYLGVRDGDGLLLAMAGERMRPPGHSEISAVCVEPAHRRRGLATALMRTLLDEIRSRGEQPFLHLAAENTAALRTYEALGFEIRMQGEGLILQAPG